MDLTFNIIFVPGMVRYFRLAILSLLKNSPYRYRLVSNGLPSEELALLKAFCATSERLELVPFPTKTTLPHGLLLNQLQQRENQQYFCFMDPDIFATAPFYEELEAKLKETDVFSSCFHFGMDPHRHAGFDGKCLKAPTGQALATTFFAVYRNEALRRVITETKIGFEPYFFADQIPASVQERLRRMGLPPVERCDTGKLLNLLAHLFRHRFRYHPLDMLLHIGGIGYHFVKRRPLDLLREKVGRMFQRPYVLSDAMVGGIDEKGSELERRKAKIQRHSVAAFFTAYLRSRFDGEPEPILALRNSELRPLVERLCTLIRELHSEHAGSLAA